MLFPKFLVALLFSFVLMTLPVRSQTSAGLSSPDSSPAKPSANDNSTYEFRKGMNEFGFWSGGAFSATTIFGGLHKDEAAGRKYFTIGLRYGRTLLARKRVALEYTFDAIPVAVAFHSIVTNAAPPPLLARENIYGAGAAPLGLKMNFGRRRVKPFASVSGGGLIFRKPVPLADAGRFAFTGDADGGVQIFTQPDRAVVLGIKFHHISNGDLSGANRGLNQFVLYAGYSVFR